VSGQLVLALAQIALALVVIVAACLVVRRRVITKRGGIVECWLRSSASGRWHHGLAEYRRAQLHWHRSFSLRIRPYGAFDRRDLVVTGSRLAGARDPAWLGPGTMIVTCRAHLAGLRPDRAGSPATWRLPAGQVADVRVIELAMSQAALTGYMAWLEAAPAGYLSEAS
jgi:hypothetical protein